jgi:pimeloyl-ACP methyl ester carboxylesterase
MKHQSGYAPVNGLKMYYEVNGEGDPIVLLHGSFMAIPAWKNVIPLFPDRQVVVAEMQGRGRTADMDREISYEAMADDVSALLTYLQVEPAHILGYSMGGSIAFQMGIRHSNQVQKLIILSGVYKSEGWWPDVEKSFAAINAQMFDGSAIQQMYHSLSPHPEKFDSFIWKTINPDLKSYDWSDAVREMPNPVLMIIGDSDGVRYEHATDLIRMKGGGKMGDMGDMSESRIAILPGVTHTGIIEQTDLLKPMIEDFLSNLPDIPD